MLSAACSRSDGSADGRSAPGRTPSLPSQRTFTYVISPKQTDDRTAFLFIDICSDYLDIVGVYFNNSVRHWLLVEIEIKAYRREPQNQLFNIK